MMKTLDLVNSSMECLVQSSQTLEDNLYCAKYERKSQLSHGAFSSVFCVNQRGSKNKTQYAAKYLSRTKDAAVQREVSLLSRLSRCSQVITYIEAFHCQFH